jgi:hypothetical protein
LRTCVERRERMVKKILERKGENDKEPVKGKKTEEKMNKNELYLLVCQPQNRVDP